MNLYWPVYQSLENETLNLASSIHFSDDQLSVYSIRIADLIVRCSVEIEAISKEIYKMLGGDFNLLDKNGNARSLYFDTDCIKLLDDKWKLGKKRVTITATTMYFQNKDLVPLHKADRRGTSGAKWKRAYQALKHDRYGSLKQGTIENLLNSLGALYILNIYYANDGYDVGTIGFGHLQFESQHKSNVFTPDVVGAFNLDFKENADDSCFVWDAENNLESAVYIAKYSDEDYGKWFFDWCVDQRRNHNRFKENDKINTYLQKHPEHRGRPIEEICKIVGGDRLLEEIVVNTAGLRNSNPKIQMKLNTNGIVYPILHKPDDRTLDDEITKRFIEGL